MTTVEKMEKADILQMTVEYMKSLASLPVTSDNSSERSYSSGYDECHRVAHAYLRSIPMGRDAKTRPVCHEYSIVTRRRNSNTVYRRRQRHSIGDTTEDTAICEGGVEWSLSECTPDMSFTQTTTGHGAGPAKTSVRSQIDGVWRPW